MPDVNYVIFLKKVKKGLWLLMVISKVSVIVPIFNARNKLPRCISSILKQTFKDFELILVNDGSTDKSLEICKYFQNKDNRIIIINKVNEGSVATRRKGVEAASSEYIMFVDADDWIHKSAIEVLYNELISESLDIVVSNTYSVLGNGFLYKKTNDSKYFKLDKIYTKDEIRNELVVAYFHGHPFPAFMHGKLYKRSLLLDCGSFLERISFLGDDLFYNMEMLLKSNKVKVINKPLYYYRIGGLTSKFMPNLFKDVINGFQIQKEIINQYYLHSFEKQMNGINIMLLNTFRTCVYNLFIGSLNKEEICQQIGTYLRNELIIDSQKNEGVKKYFSDEYLTALKEKDIIYFYKLGEDIYRMKKYKSALINGVSKMPFF
ncbi:glycosyltransferase family 2 protein [Litchfieldia alkalitelluris]|uniref:glycosyltransferase family 2 protein n=1 Tax=Litchfieldia alkalitelluris TaxID=304268 RepID=UPI001F3005E6|nr:glycosyltransferase family 2 protein [Litchfieldia alkalitelluris]